MIGYSYILLLIKITMKQHIFKIGEIKQLHKIKIINEINDLKEKY